MASPVPPDRPPIGAVRVTRHRGGTDRLFLLGIAVGLIVLGISIVLRLTLPPPSQATTGSAAPDARRTPPADTRMAAPPAADSPAATRAADDSLTPRVRPVRRTRRVEPTALPPDAPHPDGPPEQIPTDKPGIAVFPPPGTNPPKPGLVVPEDFPLPEGYVRHHQTTDDGIALEPILMFHPDFDFVDATGAPIRVPDDRVVPAELAPPGLPIRMLQVPATTIHPIERPDGTPVTLPPMR